VRIDRGGEVAAPGAAPDPVQFIDVRDLGAWIVRLADNRTMGVFNAIGPAGRLAWGDLLEACRKAGSAESKLTWVSAEFLAARKDPEFPIWSPYRGETRGSHTRSIARALKAGLVPRPYQETVRDTLAWYKAQPPAGRVKLAGPTPEQEAAILAAWHARRA
jgi:2'-hydroxyisoflavone reductase